MSTRSKESLFDNIRLEQLSRWPEIKASLGKQNLIARALRFDDFDNGYLELLKQLTVVGEVSREDFERRFNHMKRVNDLEEHYLVVIIEDTTTRKVIGASTLSLEQKFIHQCSMRGRLEDVAVLDSYRGRKIGETVVRIIVDLAHEVYRCYKISLDCFDELIKFYEKIGFKYNCNMLSIRFD